MAALKFRYKGTLFEVRDNGNADEESLSFEPAEEAEKLYLELYFRIFESHIEDRYTIDGVYWRSIDPTDDWSRRKAFVEHIGGEILEYTPVEYPEDAVF